MAEAVRLEQLKFNELDKKYRQRFRTDFVDELKYLVSRDAMPGPGPGIPGGPPLPFDTPLPKKTMKKMHRMLAMITHPDRLEVEDDAEFKEIQEAYETDDVASLISACTRHDIDIDLTVNESQTLHDRIESQRRWMTAGRHTAHWIWHACGKTERDRQEIWRVMNIDPVDFERWLGPSGATQAEGVKGE